jgi:PAS domain S-box-containing protein
MTSIFQEQEPQRAGLEPVPLPCCRMSVDGVIVDINVMGRALLAGDSVHRCLHRDDADEVLRALRSPQPSFELDCRVSDAQGAYRWHLLRAQIKGGDSWLCCFVDIDARKRREINLSHELRIRNDMLSASVDCIKVITADGTLTHMNRAGCEALGVPQTSPFGMTWLDLLPEPVRAEGAKAIEIARRGEPARFPGSSQLPGETPRYWDNMLTPLQRESGDEDVAAILCVSRDITLQREAEQRLEQLNRLLKAQANDAEKALHQAQKLEAIGRLTGNVAHDFNNLLHVIQSSIDLLQRPHLEAQKAARCMDAIANAAERGARLTSQLLAFGRRSSLTPTRFEVGANIRALSEMIGTLVGKGIAIDLIQTNPCHVFADSNQFDTAIVNLAVNACDAMKGDGVLKIVLRADVEMAERRYVTVSIEDQGCGIPEEQLESIFEPFYTTKPPGQGTGLGLSQVFGFVKQSGGEVMVESSVGKGSVFTICLPEATSA